MTERNRFLPGLAAVALFALMVVIFLGADFASAAGFSDESIVLNLGYALFDLEIGGIPSEGFLAAFLIIAIGLDVAIDSAIFLAKREEGSRFATGFGGSDATPESGREKRATGTGGTSTAGGGDATTGGGET